MKNVRFGMIAVATLVLGLASVSQAESLTPEVKAAIGQEIRDSLAAEQKALVSGGCDAAVAFFREREPLFVANGKAMGTRAALKASCEASVPPREGAKRELQHHAVQVLSPTNGYSVTTYRGGNGQAQVVTKIWEKSSDGWRIVHAHLSD